MKQKVSKTKQFSFRHFYSFYNLGSASMMLETTSGYYWQFLPA